MKGIILLACGYYMLFYISQLVIDHDDFFDEHVPGLTTLFLLCIGYVIYFLVMAKKQTEKNKEKFEKADKIAENAEKADLEKLSSKMLDAPIVRIKRKLPNFSEIDFYSSIKGIVDDFFITLNADNMDKLDYFCTQDFVENQKYKLIDKDKIFINYLFGRRRIEIVDFLEDTDEIVLATNYKEKSVSISPKTGEEMSGLTRFIEKTVYISVVESQKHSQDAVHCPNCGALLDYYLANKCNYCNNEITFNRTWIISNIEESHFNG